MCPYSRTVRQETDPRSELKPAFEVLDADRDGKISYNDLLMFYSSFSSTEGEEDVIGTMISVADSNRDGFVEYDEFERLLDGCKKSRRQGGVMEDVFRIMDTDGDGKLSYGDLKNFMTWAGFTADDEEIKAMIRFGGGGGDEDGVTYDGLLKILAI